MGISISEIIKFWTLTTRVEHMSSNFEPIYQKSVTRVQRTVFWLQRSWTSTLHTENSNVFRLYALIWLSRIQHFNAIRWLIVKIFKTWLCHWFLKYSKNLCWTAQNHHEEFCKINIKKLNKQQTTNSKQQTTNHKQQTTNNKQQTTNN